MPKFRDLKPLYDVKNPSKDHMIEAKSFACDFSEVAAGTYQEVYEPSEDSFLLIDGLHFDLLAQIEKRGKIERVMEVG